MHTDASSIGLAGMLLQAGEDKQRPVCYYSRRTTSAESKYHSNELEALTVVEALERFKVYLLGKKFRVVTDCSALTHTVSKRDLIPRISRWWLKIQSFDFDVIHRPGTKMQHIDALSRTPQGPAIEAEVADVQIYKINIGEDDWLLTMQLSDPELQKIVKILEKPAENFEEREVHKMYKLTNNRLCRRVDGKDRCQEEVLAEL